MTVTVFGYVHQCFLRFYFSIFSLVLVLTEKIYQTFKRVFDFMFKHLEVHEHVSVRLERLYVTITNSKLKVCRRGLLYNLTIKHCTKTVENLTI